MFTNVKKLSHTSVRARIATKQKLLNAIKEDYLDHAMTTKFFIDDVVGEYQRNSQKRSLYWAAKRPLKIDFSSGTPLLKVSERTYSVTAKDKRWISEETLSHSLSVYFIWCFEEFEIFLKRIYAFVGFMNKTNWQGGDFGTTVLKDIKLNTYDEYLSNVNKNSKLSSTEILKRLRKICPVIVNWEFSGIRNFKNLHWWIAYITLIRHVLVHRTGEVENTDKFEKRLRDELGVGQNNNFTEFLSVINAKYMRHSEKRCHISLCDFSKSSGIAKKCDDLLDILQIYTEFICEAVKRESFK